MNTLYSRPLAYNNLRLHSTYSFRRRYGTENYIYCRVVVCSMKTMCIGVARNQIATAVAPDVLAKIKQAVDGDRYSTIAHFMRVAIKHELETRRL